MSVRCSGIYWCVYTDVSAPWGEPVHQQFLSVRCSGVCWFVCTQVCLHLEVSQYISSFCRSSVQCLLVCVYIGVSTPWGEPVHQQFLSVRCSGVYWFVCTQVCAPWGEPGHQQFLSVSCSGVYWFVCTQVCLHLEVSQYISSFCRSSVQCLLVCVYTGVSAPWGEPIHQQFFSVRCSGVYWFVCTQVCAPWGEPGHQQFLSVSCSGVYWIVCMYIGVSTPWGEPVHQQFLSVRCSGVYWFVCTQVCLQLEVSQYISSFCQSGVQVFTGLCVHRCACTQRWANTSAACVSLSGICWYRGLYGGWM